MNNFAYNYDIFVVDCLSYCLQNDNKKVLVICNNNKELFNYFDNKICELSFERYTKNFFVKDQEIIFNNDTRVNIASENLLNDIIDTNRYFEIMYNNDLVYYINPNEISISLRKYFILSGLCIKIIEL